MKKVIFVSMVFIMLIILSNFSGNIAYGEETLASASPQIELSKGEESSAETTETPSPSPSSSAQPSAEPSQELEPSTDSELSDKIISTPNIEQSEELIQEPTETPSPSQDDIAQPLAELEPSASISPEPIDEEFSIPPSEKLNPDFINGNMEIFGAEQSDIIYGTESEESEILDAVAQFLSQYNNDHYSDFEKIVAAHDYIVYTCNYDMVNYYAGTLPYNVYTAYGVFVEHKAVCAGYARALEYLLDIMDIECYYVTSNAMNHAWNIVKLNGKYYHIDATWDDPVKNYYYDEYEHYMPIEGYCKYKYFLVSDDELANHYDWHVDAPACTSTDYNWLRDYRYPHMVGHKIYTLNDYYSYIYNADTRTYTQTEYVNDSAYNMYLSYKDGYLFYYNYYSNKIYEHNINSNSREVLVSNIELVDMYIDGDIIRYYDTDLSQMGSTQIPDHGVDSNIIVQDGFAFNKSTGTIFDYTGTSTDVSIPSSIDGVRVEIIGTGSFNHENITSINIPSSVTKIRSDSFYGSANLQSIVLPDSITDIEGVAFYGCTSLENVTLPSGIDVINKYTFANCSSLLSVDIPDGVTVIGEYAFSGCESLKNIVLPDDVTCIGYKVFNGCSSLESIHMPENYSGEIHDYMFYFLKSLQSINIPQNVTKIGRFSFYECRSLQEIILSDNITDIGEYAFYYCESFESIKLPANMEEIKDNVFWYCRNLQNIDIPNGVTRIGEYAFARCYNLQSINIPETVDEISAGAFYACQNLVSINIPSGITAINGGTFQYCSQIKNIVLPYGVSKIDVNAFSYSSSLRHIYIPSTVDSIEYSSFEGCNYLTILGEDGSYVQTYAKENNITFNVYNSEADFNSDFVIDLLDLTILALYYNQIKDQYDLVSDGKINIYDLVALAKYIY